MEPYWESNGHAPHPVKYESDAAVSGFSYCTENGLNFSTSTATYSEDDTEYTTGRRGKTSRQDPLSHRIIEKRRRDRMNSCLADLSRLIPPQYQRKGRGRIEKTEIIEMAIRHLKHLQNECVHKEIEYKLGYSDCMKEAAKFLYDSHMQDFCYRLIGHLQEHCEEIMKSDCFKNRCNADSVSASSGSPSAHTNYHPAAPLSQLRDMLTSDIDHSNSNDHNDVKDLSFRTQPHQAPVITSTAPPIVHHETSNHEFDSPRGDHNHHHNHHQQYHRDHPHIQENGISSSPPHHSHPSESILKSVRLRNFSESSHDIEHNNNNYKYKNHIKQRFNQDSHLHDESTNDYGSIGPNNHINENINNLDHYPPPKSEPGLVVINGNCTNNKKRKIDPNGGGIGCGGDVEDEICSYESTATTRTTATTTTTTTTAGAGAATVAIVSTKQQQQQCNQIVEDTKSESPIITKTLNGGRHFVVPIFALHGQGTYYVPLNIDYEALLPYLQGIDLLEKNFCSMPVLHPVNINVNFTPSGFNNNNSNNSSKQAQQVMTANFPRTKIEAVTNGW